MQETPKPRRSVHTDLQLMEANDRTEQTIVEAEKFHAQINKPPGELNLNHVGLNSQLGEMSAGTGLMDDNFFHLTCHIDSNLKQKIEKGEFVDLDKLLPRDKIAALNGYSEDSRMEWVQRDGGMYLVPARKETRINNFHLWEQEFHLYASIYCDKNPCQMKEIWQYISVIQTAVSAYIWENVYSYDITFHQLMQFNPNRSWAVTYNQMWNLSMCEPLPKNRFGHGNGNQTGNGSSQSSEGKNKCKKADYC